MRFGSLTPCKVIQFSRLFGWPDRNIFLLKRDRNFLVDIVILYPQMYQPLGCLFARVHTKFPMYCTALPLQNNYFSKI